jgi:ribonuclease HII
MQSRFNTKKDLIEVGCDEAGRGPLLGPVYAAAVIWDPNVPALDIKDSKKLTKRARERLAQYIETHAVAYGVASIDNERIDNINILQAAIEAMHNALDKIPQHFDMIIVDGTYFKPYQKPNGDFIPHNCVKEADNTYVSVAAASILAKVYHDKWIKDTVTTYPELDRYGLLTNQGYGTKKHLDAITEHGITQFHRKSFKPIAATTNKFQV